MKRNQILDLYFVEARSKLIDLAAFLDRVDRAPGADDFRVASLRRSLRLLAGRKTGRAGRVLMALSDPTRAPIVKAGGKSACGAWPGKA